MTEDLVLTAKFKVNNVAAAAYSNLLKVDTSSSNYFFADADDNTVIPAAFPSGGDTFSATVPKAPITSVSFTLDAPAKGTALPSLTALGSGYTGVVEWYKGNTATGTAVTGSADANQGYTAKVTLTAKEGESFANTVTVPDGYTLGEHDNSKVVLTKTFAATAGKDTPTINTVPTASAITYGQKLSDSTLSGGAASVVEGSFQWKTPATAPQVSDSNITEYDVIFTPTDAANYTTATCKVKLEVNPKNLTDVAVDAIADQGYTGSQITPAVTVKGDGDKTLVLNQDYTVEYGTNKDVGTGTVTVKAKSGSNYTFSDVTKNFTIKAASSTISITGDPGKTYDGEAVTTPTVSKTGSTGTVTYIYYTDSTCTTKTSTANGAASEGAAPKNAGSYWVMATVAADTNHSEAISEPKPFTISRKDISGATITLGTQNTYNGNAQDVVITSVTDGSTLTPGTDYTVKSGGTATNVGNNTLVIEGKGNYKETAQTNWTLQAKDISGVTVTVSGTYTYTGSAITPTYTVKDGSDTVADTNYTAAVTNNTSAGTATITLTGKGNYTGTKTQTFTIDNAAQTIIVPTEEVTVSFGSSRDLSAVCSSNASSATLSFAVKSGSTLPTGTTLAGSTVTAGTTAGTFVVTVNAVAVTNYNAAEQKEFTVKIVSLPAASVTTAPTAKTGLTYNGTEQELITAGSGVTGGTLQYKLDSGAYSANLPKAKNAGTYTVYYKVVGNDTTHSDSTEMHFDVEIKAKTLTSNDLTYEGAITKVYDTNTNAPTGLTVSVKPASLVSGDTLTVTGTLAYNSANVNEANTITFTPNAITTGNYRLAASEMLTITGASITQATPTYTVPTGLTATYGQTLVNVNIAATIGWSWMNSAASVGDASTTPKTFKAKFTPTDTVNYKTVDDIAVSVTVNKADARSLADIAVSQKYSVTAEQSKQIGSIMPADAGTLSYTKGTENKTGSVIISSWDVDSTGKVTYTLANGAAGDTVTLSVKISSTNYADSTVNVKITLSAKDDQATLTLTGGTTVVYGQTLTLSTTGGSGTGTVTYEVVAGGTGAATIAGNVLTPTTAGTVTVKAVKAADVDYNQAESAPVTITINKATPTGTPNYTAITASGKTLADAALGIGDITPAGGTIAWDLGSSQTVAANTAYAWTYTPADTANYNTLTGSITPYVVSYGGGGGSVTTYSVTVGKTENGTVSVSPKSAAKGDTVTVTVTPDKGYVLETLTALDKDGKELKLTAKDGKYTFTMPAGKVEIKATFMDDNTMLNYFVDVKAGDYFYDAVLWAAQKGITNGVNAVEFGPNLSCTRAQIVTFLWRAAGSPEPKGTGSFADVPAGSYYAKAVAWAVENGITGGVGNGKFDPNATCTREQAVTFLYRASGSPAVSGGSTFSDVAENAYYADAVVWAEKNGITGGIGGGLFGSGNDCTRAQIVTLLYRAYSK